MSSTAVGTIVVGVDGSANSVEALRWAGRQAATTGAALRAVYVWEFPYMDIVLAGSVASKAVNHATVPVAVIRS